MRESSEVSRQAIFKSASGESIFPDAFMRGSRLPDPFASDQSRVSEHADGGAEDSLHTGISTPPRLLHDGGRSNDAPHTPLPRRQRHLIDAQDQSPSVRTAERRSKRKPSSPANIEGGWEHINAREATYGGGVSAASAGSPWANNPRSFV